MSFLSAWAKLCCIAVLVIVQVSAFSPAKSAAPGAATGYRRDASCSATNKRDNCPGKTAFDGSKVGGIGGLGMNYKISKPAATKKKAAKPAPKKKSVAKAPPKKSVESTSRRAPDTEADWGSIILLFLTPWRNPNSIFLYMLVIVSVLGKINEAK